MKHRITEAQWLELTNEQRTLFLRAFGEINASWLYSLGIRNPLPSLGELIQFLAEQTKEQGWLHIETPSERKCGWRVQCK